MSSPILNEVLSITAQEWRVNASKLDKAIDDSSMKS